MRNKAERESQRQTESRIGKKEVDGAILDSSVSSGGISESDFQGTRVCVADRMSDGRG